MIGATLTGNDGQPLDNNNNKLSKSSYQPPPEVMKLFARSQDDYQRAWRLQHRPFDEFDGVSLLQRAKVDQETFGAFVGAQYVPQQTAWRWRGRKNTARNKVITILANMISGMLYPLVSAQNEDAEEDKLSATVMRIVIENHLKKAGYETKFMYFVLSALVNPACLVEVQYMEAYQRIKEDLGNGQYKITEAVDALLSGLQLMIVPIDQLLVADFYVNDIQQQPFVVRVNRIPWDMARKIYSGRYYMDGKDLFDYVEAGKTRIFLAGQEHLTLYDVEWTEADRTAVQVITMYYRDEDLEIDWVGGVGMFDYNQPYMSNRFKHRRLSLVKDEWKSVPIYPFAKSYYEPIDPAGRFFYGKSASFKEFWDDRSINHAYRLLQDGMTLEVIKPLFLSGVAKVDGIVIAPGAAIGMPQGAGVEPWSMSPNLAMAMQVIEKNEADIGLSTAVQATPGQPTPNVPATQTIQAVNQAARQLSVIGLTIADLVRQVGELVVDCTIQHTLSGEIDASIPSDLVVKYKTILAKTNEKGKTMTNRIHFKSNLIGKEMTPQQVADYEWKLWKDRGGDDQTIYHVNPYKFARMQYGVMVDADEIVNHALGNDRQTKLLRYQMLTQEFVYPFTDQKEVADAVIEEFSDGSPDRFKSKQQNNPQGNPMLSAIMGQANQPGTPTPPVPSPMQPSSGNPGPLQTALH